MPFTFVKLIEDRPGRAIWRDEEGNEKEFAAPKMYRLKCAGRLDDGKPCYRKAAGSDPYCRPCQKQHMISSI